LYVHGDALLCHIQQYQTFKLLTTTSQPLTGKAFLEQAHEMITEDEQELFELLAQAQVKMNDAVVATREAEQAVAQLIVAVRDAH
jgi:UDP-2,3-diacylglucosamine pyrophosphatase LpxH